MAGRSEKYEPNVGDVVLVLTGRHFGRVCTILVKCESGQTYWARTKSGAMAYLFEGEFIPHDLAKRTIENQTGRGPWWVPERGFEACGAVNLCSGVRCELPNHGGLHAAIVAGDVVVWRGARVRFRVHKTREVTGKCWECEGVRGRGAFVRRVAAWGLWTWRTRSRGLRIVRKNRTKKGSRREPRKT